MRVVDTSAWIEWVLGTPLGQRVASELPSPEQWIVPTIVQFELARWLAREISAKASAEAIAFSNQNKVQVLDTDLATKAADYAALHGLAMADAIIYATAVDAGAELLTCDAHFQNLPGVIYLAKTTP